MKTKNYIRLWQILQKKFFNKFLFIILFSIFVTFTDIITIAAIFPFLTAIINPEILYEIDFLKNSLLFFNIDKIENITLFLTLVFCASVILASLSRLSLAYFQISLSQNTSIFLKQEIYKKILFQPYEFHFENNSGDLIALILAKAQETSGKVITPFLNIISSSLIVISVFFLLVVVNTSLTLYLFTFLVILYGVVIFFTKKILIRNSKIISTSENQIVRIMQEGIGGIRDVILNNIENFYINLLYKTNLNFKNAALKVNFIGIIPRSVIEGVGISMIALIAYFSVNNNIRSDILIPTFATLALGAQRTLPLLQQIFKNWSEIKGHEARLDEVLKFLNLEIPKHLENPQKINLDFKSNIFLQNISFSFKNNEKKIIKDLNLKINKGDKIGIIGKTGSGKTTLINIIMGLLLPKVGKIYIDNTELKDSNLNNWRMNIAHVPQNIYLSDNSISQNIAVGIPKNKIDKKLLVEVSKKAQILEVIENMEDKFETIVGERGVKLSGGQLQRIGIARALYKNARLIILDEATSALDLNTERLIMKIVDDLSQDLTIIIIAHRLSSLENCNKIIEIEDGKIINNYSYNALKEKP